MPVEWFNPILPYATSFVSSALFCAVIGLGLRQMITIRVTRSIGLEFDKALAEISLENAKVLQEQKSQLEAANSVSLQQLKSQLEATNAKTLAQQSHELQLKAAEQSHALQLKAKEFELKYTIMHEKRAQVVASLFARMNEFVRRLDIFRGNAAMNKMATREEIEEFATLLNQFTPELNNSAIYLKASLVDKIDLIRDGIAKWLMSYAFGSALPPERQDLEGWSKRIVGFRSELKSALEALADEMRKLLGVDSLE